MTSLARRTLLAGLAALAATPARAAEALRIGYQKNGSFVILRKQATLEALFAPRGVAIQWVEFGAGPPITEAINAGAIDIGATGDTPPIFAQAAGTDFVYAGAQPLPGNNQAVIVRDDGPITTLAALRGRRIAYTRGSSAHHLVLRVLERAGLTLADIQSVPLAPADAAAAFRSGAVDAWAIWDPYLAIAEQDRSTRVLIPSSEVAPTNNFILARRSWAVAMPDRLRTVLDAVNAAAVWARTNPDSLAALMADVTGVPLAAQRLAAPRGTYAVQPMDDRIVAQQQQIADTFAAMRIIPGRINIRQAVWVAPEPTTN